MNRRARAALVGSILLTACDSPTDLNPREVSGLWNLTFTEQAECGSVVDLSLVQLDLFVADDGSAPNGQFGTRWNPLGIPNGWYAASGQLRGDQLQLELFGTGNNSAMRLEGQLTATAFTGTARDPGPGRTGVYTLGACQYAVTGEKQ